MYFDTVFFSDLDKDDTLCIYQSAINPPHFQVVIGKTSHNLPKVL